MLVNAVHNRPFVSRNSFDLCSLLNNLPNLLKTFPQTFEISTNNGKYNFNKDLASVIFPAVDRATKNNKDISQFHFNINDTLDIMKKFESIFKGEPVDFFISEEEEIGRISKLFVNKIFTITLKSKNKNSESLQDSNEKLSLKINLQLLFKLLENEKIKTFKIKTNQNNYICNSLGVMSSDVILTFLKTNPNATEYSFDFEDENKEFEPISRYFNFEEVKINSDTIDSIQMIAAQLEITPIIELSDEIYDKYDDNLKKSTENQEIIESYDELFERLFNINKTGYKEVAEFILKSDWVKSEAEVEELVACFRHIILSDVSVHREIADLIVFLSEKQEENKYLSIIIPFLTKKILTKQCNTRNLSSFIYQLYRKKVISIDLIIKYISFNFGKNFITTLKNNYYTLKNQYILIWFFPELIERNLLSEKLRSALQKNVPYIDSNITTVEQMKESRENYVEKDSIINALKNDDVDTLQTIISTSGIDIQSKKIALSIFENSIGICDEISFIDYAAKYGSIKCFKYLYLNNATINYSTYAYSVYGKNVEIIRIIDQNKKDFPQDFYNFNNFNFDYRNKNQLIEIIKTAIKMHEYKIFDWLFEQNKLKSEQDYLDLFECSILAGNAYSMTEIIKKFSNLNKLGSKSIVNIITAACYNGFYKILKFLVHLINFHDLADPTKGEFADSKDVSNRRQKIKSLNLALLRSSTSFGMIEIFELILKETGIKNSECLFNGLLEAVNSKNLNIVKYILDNKLYQLSPLFMMELVKKSIESDCDEITNYFFEKEIMVSTDILQAACIWQNLKLVKLLIQKAEEKRISLDFTYPFINAVNPFYEDICRYFIEMKVQLNYHIIMQEINVIIEKNPNMIILLVENADSEIKDDIIKQSIKAAIRSRDMDIFKYLFSKGISMNGLLMLAIRDSDLTVVKTILEYNQTPEFINQIEINKTALHEAIYCSRNDIVEYLLQLPGIDPGVSVDSVRTPLIEAVDMDNLVAVDLILKYYGDSIKDQGCQIQNAFKNIINKRSRRNQMDQRSENEQLIFGRLLDIKKKFNPVSQNEEDLLSYAILENDFNNVEKLLTIESTNLKHRLQNGNTYLHIAIKGPEITEIHKLLIDHPDVDINSQNAFSETPLIKATEMKNVELINLILSHPKFDPKLSLIDYAFYLSISSKEISRIFLKVESLDVNNCSKKLRNQQIKVTPLMKALRYNDIELAELIIHHPSFDPSKSRIKACLFNSVRCKNLELFRFLLKMCGNEINIKDDRNKSLLARAALIKDNDVILNEILNNENFDPVKSDIKGSFLESNNQRAMKILISYDEKHGNYLSFEKIDLEIHLKNHFNRNMNIGSLYKSYQYLLRKKGIIPTIHPICTSILSKNGALNQIMYKCETCGIEGICEICIKVCHKSHKIVRINIPNSNTICQCSSIDHQCKCISTQSCSDDEEIYESIDIENKHDDDFYGDIYNDIEDNFYNDNIYNGNYSDYDYDYDGDDGGALYNNLINYQHRNHINDNYYPNLDNVNDNLNIPEDYELSFDKLRCSLDLSRYKPILQIMYHCNRCQVDVCQNCAIRCHKGHSLIYNGMVNNSYCYCKDITDCKCTDRKTVVCNYLFYGTEYIKQPWFKCDTCGTKFNNKGCCAICSRTCHKGHIVHSDQYETAFCDCGATDLDSICRCMKYPQFNYLTCCTNRNQKYVQKEQRMYHCFTCGITSKDQGICESCAIHCHFAHNVVFVGTCSFACECAIGINAILGMEKIKCVAYLCPEMNSHGACSRLNKNKDSVCGKFICYTCDKEGKNAICESCAVKCHQNHDVHLIEYSDFECNCENCKCMENEEEKESI